MVVVRRVTGAWPRYYMILYILICEVIPYVKYDQGYNDYQTALFIRLAMILYSLLAKVIHYESDNIWVFTCVPNFEENQE